MCIAHHIAILAKKGKKGNPDPILTLQTGMTKWVGCLGAQPWELGQWVKYLLWLTNSPHTIYVHVHVHIYMWLYLHALYCYILVCVCNIDSWIMGVNYVRYKCGHVYIRDTHNIHFFLPFRNSKINSLLFFLFSAHNSFSPMSSLAGHTYFPCVPMCLEQNYM